MKRYILSRLIQSVFVLFVISLIVFLLIRAVPKDPIYVILGPESQGITPEQYAQMKHDLGLDRSLPVQYVMWAQRMVTGDWGHSFKTKRPVTQELATRIPYSLQLAVLALLLSVVIGITTGVVAALKRNGVLDVISSFVAIAGVALPNFWFALILILVFSVHWNIFPAFGGKLIWQDPLGALQAMVLPAAVLGLSGTASIMRQMRSSMLEVMGEDYVRTARAKGLHERKVIWSHAFRNALLPIVTLLGLRLGGILGGSVIVETIFSWPGVGRLAVSAIQEVNYPVVQVIVVVSGATVLLANLITDISYAYIDPRIHIT
ncbi:MAG: ABC transporter permease [Chloroflexi bacterium]|nr:ABC transporter permease [Chloroflexota bacterium]